MGRSAFIRTRMSNYTLASTAYLDIDVSTSVCYIDQDDWERRLTESTDIRRLFAVISFSNEVTRVCAVEHVARRHTPQHMENPIFVPLWMLPEDAPLGDTVEVEFFSQDAFPEASRIVLKPLDSAFYNTDAKEMLTESLTRLGVLKKGDTVLLNLEELGGYEMGFYVSELEPADIVLLNAEEVVVEFEEAADQWDGRRPVTAPPEAERSAPPQAVTPIPEEPEMLPSPDISGTVLGGGPVRRMADGRPWNPYR